MHPIRVLALFALLVSGLSAADATYISASGTWSTASNWSTGTVPTVGQSVDIPLGTTVTLDTTTPALSGVDVAGALTIASGGSLQTAAVASSGTVTLGNGTIKDAVLGGTGFSVTGSGGVLDGVTIAFGTTLDLATINGAACYLNNAVTIDGVIMLGSANGSTYGRLYWTTASTWGGSGSILFGNSGNNGLFGQSGAAPLTLGGQLLVHGANGYIQSPYSGSTFTNHGTITSDGGGTLTLNFTDWSNDGVLSANLGSTLALTGGGTGVNSGSLTTDGGTLTVTGGTWTTTAANGIVAGNGTLNLGGAWSASGGGTIVTLGSTVRLGGTFTTAQALAVQHSGATDLRITGTMDNSGATLALDPSTGSWTLDGGTINGGTISGTANEKLYCHSTVGRLSGVAITAGTTIDLAAHYGAGCYFSGAMTIDGHVALGNGDGSNYGRLYWDGDTTWDGTGDIAFGPNGNNGMFAQTGGTTLTLGAGLLVHGVNGYIYANYGGSRLVNQGTILSDGAGTITMNLIDWDNSGLLGADGSCILTMSVTGTWDNSGTLIAASGGTLVVNATGTGTSSGTITTTGGILSIGGNGGTWTTTVPGGVSMTDGTLTLGGAWSGTGAGTITTSGGTVRMAGTFTTAEALEVQRSNGTVVRIGGAMDNTAAVLPLEPTGTWLLDGGSITGGSISGGPGEWLTCTSTSSRLTDVTITAGTTLDLATQYGANCYVSGTLTLDGVALLGSADGVNYGRLYWDGDVSFAGGGEIRFGANGNNGMFTQAGGTTAVFGAGLTIHGINGYINANYGGSVLHNHATISSDGGGTIAMNLLDWDNDGALTADTGSALTITSGGTWINTGTVTAAAGGAVTITSSGSGTNDGLISTTGGALNIGGSGTWTTTGAGGVSATDGSLTLGGTWSASGGGTIVSSGSTVRLGGSYTTAAALALQYAGATTYRITGTLDNSGATLPLGLGIDWVLDGGTISGGIIGAAVGDRLTGTSTTGRLVDATLAAGAIFDLAANYGAGCYANGACTFDGQVLLGSTDGANYGRLYWDSAITTWGGSGEILYGANGNNGMFAQAANTSLTLGSGLTIHGINGYISATYGGSLVVNDATIQSDGGGTFYLYNVDWVNHGSVGTSGTSAVVVNNSGTWSNDGAITAASGGTVSLGGGGSGVSSGTMSTTGGSLTVAGTGTWTTTAAGGVSAVNGTLSLGGTWSASGAGTIVTSGSAVNLGGSFTTARALAVGYAGASTVRITGAMDNAGATLDLSGAGITWWLDGGSITGGTIGVAAGDTLRCAANSNNLIDGATIAAGTLIDLTQVWGAATYLNNTVTIDGQVQVGSVDGSNYGRLYWSSPVTAWNGSGDIQFGANGNNGMYVQAASTTLTIGAGLTVHGRTAAISATQGGSQLVNDGTIASDVAGGGFTFNVVTAVNNGTIGVGPGSVQTWSCSGNFTQSASGALEFDIAGTGAGQADRLNFGSGTALVLDGTVRVASLGGFVPTPATSVVLINLGSGSVSGAFAAVEGAYTMSYGATTVTAVGTAGASAPALTLASAAGDPTTTAPIPVTATFSVPVTGFDAADLAPVNATVANFAGGGASYTFDLIPTVTQGTVQVAVAAGAASDDQFQSSAASNTLSRLYNGSDPLITAISPAGGTTAGGTPVVISGSGFLSGQTTVTFGGAAAAVGAVDATSISCTTPPGAAGGVDVVVTVAGRSATAVAGFTYAVPTPADATFTGTGSSWNTAANWSTGTVPGAGQSVDIPSGKSVTLDVNTAVLGTVTVEGALTIPGSRIFEAAALVNGGSVTLSGGTIRNTAVGGALLTFTTGGGVLDGVTMDSDIRLTGANNVNVTVQNLLRLNNGRSIQIGDATFYGRLLFAGAGATVDSVSGTAAVAFGASPNNAIVDSGVSAMTIGAGIAVTGGSGYIYTASASSTLAIAGTVTVQNGTLGVGYYAGYPWISSGTLQAAGGTLTLAGAWSNGGTIGLGAGTVNLGGSFAGTSVDGTRWNRAAAGTAGTVNLTGSLANGGNLVMDATTGSWRLLGGTVTGGTVTGAGAQLIGTTSGGTLDGLTLDADLPLTGANNANVTIRNTVLLGNGRTIAVGDASFYGRLNFAGAAAVLDSAGTAFVTLGDNGSNGIVDSGVSAMTIGAGITVTGGSGTIYTGNSGSTLAIAGTVLAQNGTLGVGYYAGYPWTSTGTVSAVGGTLTLAGTWSTSGTIGLVAGTVNLGGSFTDTSVAPARWGRAGEGTAGTVNLTGSLANGGNLILDASTGSWRLVGGTVTGGTVTGAGSQLIGTTSGGTLDGLTLDADLPLAGANNANVTIRNTVLLGNGRTITVGDASFYGRLLFAGAGATLDSAGTAFVTFGANGSNGIVDNGVSAMTIGAGIAVTGGSGTIYTGNGTSTLAIAGTVTAQGPGTVAVGYYSYPWSSSGTLQAAGGTLALAGAWSNTGTLGLSAGTVNLGGTFAGTSVAPARWNRAASGTAGTVNLTGSLANSGNLILDASTGSWQLLGGTVTGGTVTGAGAQLIGTTSGGTLDGLTYDADLALAGANNANVTIRNTVLLGSGRTIAVGDASFYGRLYFAGAGAVLDSVSGTAFVAFSTNGSNVIVDNGITGMTIGAGITVTGGSGTIYTANGSSTLAIAGTVTAQGPGTLAVGYYAYPWSSSGTLQAAGGTLALAGAWSNSGTIGLSAGAVNLGGSFAGTSVDGTRWNRAAGGTAGTVNLTGALANAGTLALDAQTGAWQLAGGSITGGTVVGTAGGQLVGTTSGGTLDGLTYDADLPLTGANGVYATLQNTVLLGNGRTITIGDATHYGVLYFNGAATLDTAGTASVVFGENGSNAIRDITGSTVLTIGPGIAVTGGSGSLYTSYGSSSMAIAGSVASTTPTGTVTVGYSTQPWSSSGTLLAGGGALTLSGAWSSSGTLAVTGGALNLGGQFAAGSVAGARWSRGAGGTVNLTGTVAIAPGVLALDAQTGSWRLAGGTLSGGTVSDPGGRLVCTTSGGAFDGVTIPAGTVIDLSQVNGAQCYLNNAMTIDGTVLVGRTDATTYGYLYSNGAATWGGSGEILLGGSTNNGIYVNNGGGSLSIGAGLTVHGKNGTLWANYGGSSFTNHGTIASDVSGGAFSISAISFINDGTLAVGRGTAQNWNCSGGFTQTPAGVLELDIGGTGAGQADRLAISSATVVLDGTVRITSLAGFVPTPATVVDVLTISSGTLSGTFASVVGGYSLGYSATKVTATGLAGLSAPTVAITSAAGDPVTTSPIPLTVTFSTPVSGLTLGDLLVSGGTLANFAGSGATYTLDLLPSTGQGTVAVSVTAGAAYDAQLLTNGPSTTFQRFYNGTDPVISGISPASGYTAGGDALVISGSWFVSGMTSVTIGGNPAVVGTVDSGSIALTSPAGAAGAADVVVTSAGRSATLVGGFTYSSLLPPPAVTLVSIAGDPTTTAPIPVAATFDQPVTGLAAAGISVVNGTVQNVAGSGTSWTFEVVPVIGQGTVSVTVLAGAAVNGQGTGNSASATLQRFYNGVDPTISLISPANGPAGGGTTLTISGSGFLPGMTTVLVDGVPVTLDAEAADSLTFTSTAHAPGAVDVVVDVTGRTATALGAFTYDATLPAPLPTIGSPAGDPVLGGPIAVTVVFDQPVTGFAAAGIAVGNATVANFAGSGTTYTFDLVPTVAQGTVTAGVAAGAAVNGEGTGNQASGILARFYNTVDPQIDLIVPANGPVSGGTAVTITGSGFANGWTTVLVDGAAAEILTVTATTIDINTPAGTAGAVDVEVLVAGRTATATGGFTYDAILPPPAVTLSSIAGDPATSAPIAVTATFDQPVTGFAADDIVATNATVANFTGSGATYTFDLVPTVAQGVVDADIAAGAAFNGQGTGSTAAAQFERFYNGIDPVIDLISPANGPQAGGTAVTITGSGFVGTTTVTIGGVDALIDAVTPTTIDLTTPPGAAGPVDVVVLSAGRTATAGDGFTYDAVQPAPAVTLASAAGDPTTASPIAVTITFDQAVTGFTVADLTLGNATAANFAGSGATYTVDLLPTVGQGTVSAGVAAGVAVNGQGTGNSAATTLTRYFNGVSPTITLVSPNHGPQAGGTAVVISGTAFVAGRTTVTIGGATAAVGAVSATSAAITTPAGSGAATVVVTVAGRSASLAAGFTYDAPPAPPVATFATTAVHGVEGAGVVTGVPAVRVTVQLSSPSAQTVSVPFTIGGTATAGSDFTSSASPVVFTPGVVSQDIVLTLASDAPDGAGVPLDETVVLTLGTPANATLGAQTVSTVTIVDQEPMAVVAAVGAGAPQAVPGGGLALTAAVGQTITVGFLSGVPPYTITPAPGMRFFAFTPQFVPNPGSNGTVDPAEQALLVALSAGSGTVQLTDSAGTAFSITLTATPLSPTTLAAPPLTLSAGTATVYGAICPGTTQGLTRLLAALAGKTPDVARGFWWDGVDQAYRELTAGDSAGITPTSAVFVATRTDLGLDFSGDVQPFYQELTLEPGWSFVGLPPLGDGTTVATSHPWTSLVLFDAAGVQITGTERDALIGTGAYAWDGTAYAVAGTLVSGRGYWIKNNTVPGATLSLVRFPPGVDPSGVTLPAMRAAAGLASASRLFSNRQPAAAVTAGGHGYADRGVPPSPPAGSKAGSAADDVGGGGCGSGGMGLILLGLTLALVRRRRR